MTLPRYEDNPMLRFNRDMVRKYGVGFLDKLDKNEKRTYEILMKQEKIKRLERQAKDEIAAKDIERRNKKAIKKGSYRDDDPRADDRIGWTVRGR